MVKLEAAPPEAKMVAIPAQGDAVTIPDAHLLFAGHFSRHGSDLILTGDDGNGIIVLDYFGDAGRPTLVSPDGATLKADVVAALAGPLAPGEYAQAGAAAPQAAIGKVAKLTGTATVQ